jgi:hypothetical protein
MVGAIHKIMHIWYDFPVEGVILGGDMVLNHHGAKFSILVSVLRQSSWKLCVYLYLGFAAPVPEHNFLHAIVIYVQHSLVGRNQSPAKVCVRSQMFWIVELCKVDIASSFPPLQGYDLAF